MQVLAAQKLQIIERARAVLAQGGDVSPETSTNLMIVNGSTPAIRDYAAWVARDHGALNEMDQLVIAILLQPISFPENKAAEADFNEARKIGKVPDELAKKMFDHIGNLSKNEELAFIQVMKRLFRGPSAAGQAYSDWVRKQRKVTETDQLAISALSSVFSLPSNKPLEKLINDARMSGQLTSAQAEQLDAAMKRLTTDERLAFVSHSNNLPGLNELRVDQLVDQKEVLTRARIAAEIPHHRAIQRSWWMGLILGSAAFTGVMFGIPGAAEALQSVLPGPDVLAHLLHTVGAIGSAWGANVLVRFGTKPQQHKAEIDTFGVNN
jgi:hypothetical protein